ncbi:MAG: hypothetical protein AAF762_01270 [Pseudomonadota bacterium]
MPIVIDANRAGDFTPPISGHAGAILLRLRNRTIRIVLGGELKRELASTKFINIIVEQQRSGQLLNINDEIVDEETDIVVALGIQSNDPHVLALLRVSETRLLYTEDGDLMVDARDTRLVNPRSTIITPTTPAPRVRGHLNDHAN